MLVHRCRTVHSFGPEFNIIRSIVQGPSKGEKLVFDLMQVDFAMAKSEREWTFSRNSVPVLLVDRVRRATPCCTHYHTVRIQSALPA